MSRRVVIPLAVILLALASLAAVAAVATTAAPTFQVTPQLHHLGNEGYFMIFLPRTEHTPPLPPAVAVRVVEGDAWLVSVRTKTIPDGSHSAATTTGQELIVCGRFARPGPVRLAILGRTAGDSVKPLMNLSFIIPNGRTAKILTPMSAASGPASSRPSWRTPTPGAGIHSATTGNWPSPRATD